MNNALALEVALHGVVDILCPIVCSHCQHLLATLGLKLLYDILDDCEGVRFQLDWPDHRKL